MVKKTKTMLDTMVRKPVLPPDYPVNEDLTSKMLIDVAVNRDSEVWVFHSQPFPGVLEWVEYDIDEARLIFITKGGKLNDFGITIGPVMRKYLQSAQQISAYLIMEKQIHDFIQVPLIARRMMH